MNSTKEYLEAMNQLDKYLNTDDKEYFTNLREYLNTFKFKKDELAINEQLYQMYLDFLDAQEEGLTAEEYFGSEPKEMADHLLEEMPKTTFRTLLKYIGIVAIVFWSIRLFIDFSDKLVVVINPALYLFDLVLIISLILILFKLIQKSVYRKIALEDINKIEAMFVLLILLIYIFLYFNANEFIPNIFTFSISYPWDIVLIIIFSIIITTLFYNLKINQFYRVPFTLTVLSLIGIEMRLAVYTRMRVPIIPLKYRFIISGSLLILNYILNKRDLKENNE